LLEWTKKRWIISFSKKKGLPTIKEQKKNIKNDLLKSELKTDFSKEVEKLFPDAELLEIEKDKI